VGDGYSNLIADRWPLPVHVQQRSGFLPGTGLTKGALKRAPCGSLKPELTSHVAWVDRYVRDELTAAVIVQKPSGHAAILLDIELAPPIRQLEEVHFALTDQEGRAVANWVAAPSPQGRASVLINSEQIPVSQLWLEISSGSGDPIERRLLEFR